MINKKILFLVEGEYTEKKNVKNIAKKMFHLLEEEYEIVSYNTTIYELYDELKNDDMLSLVGLLKSQEKLALKPGELSKQAFSQIYLIFDYDPHYQKYSDDEIRDILGYFNNETENGKIYINYPMFEATFHLRDYNLQNNLLEYININDINGKTFKKEVKRISCFGKNNHKDFTLSNTIDVWYAIKWNYLKYICFMNDEELNYIKLLEKQIELKNNESKILIISTFVLLIIDYNPKLLKVILSNIH